jgi:hypothetical protein
MEIPLPVWVRIPSSSKMGIYRKAVKGVVKGGDKADSRSTYEDGRGKPLRVAKAKEVIQWIKPRKARRE